MCGRVRGLKVLERASKELASEKERHDAERLGGATGDRGSVGAG